MNVKKPIMIIAGEDSGDLHGSALIAELKNIDPALQIYGIGGQKMIEAGMTPQYHIKDMAFLGFAEVVKHIPFIRKVQRELLNVVKNRNIKEVVLIDYPGFNLSLAKKLKKLDVKIIYYISPQVWAWGKGRLKKMKRLIDLMIVVFPFEKELYKNAGVKVEYAGHPLVERMNSYPYLSKSGLYEKFNLDDDKDLLLLMPGSRKQEIEKIFPESIKAAVRLSNELNMQTVVACSGNIDENIFRKLTHEKNFTIIKEHTYDLLKHAKFGIIKSGTSTLEAGLAELPFVVVYSTSALTYFIGKKLIQIDSISMTNIILDKKVIPELIQKDMNTEKIYSVAKSILTDIKKYELIKSELEKLKLKLGSGGASKRAAELIYAELND